MQPSAKAYHLLATSMLLGACSYAPSSHSRWNGKRHLLT